MTLLFLSIQLCGFQTPSNEHGYSCLRSPNADLDLSGRFDSDCMKRKILGLNLATFQGISRNFDWVSMKFDDR